MYPATRSGILILIAGALLLYPRALPGQQETATQSRSGQSESRPDPFYVIQPNDVLEIFVWKESELSRKVVVRPDGRISFPLVQDLKASGLSPGELKEKIEEQLKAYLTAPNVTVIVESIQSYRIFVVGKAQKPGAVVVEKPISVLQAIAMAGGFADFAKESEITIVRNFENETLVFDFNYKDVIKGRHAEQNIYLRNGDVVVIP